MNIGKPSTIGWILTDDNENGWCKLSNKFLQSKLSAFSDHKKSAQHKGQVAAINQVQPIFQSGLH